MIININKFGTILTSRQLGKEALAAFLPSLDSASDDEDVCIDFEGVDVFSPSWGDEFLRPLCEKFGSRLVLRRSQNLSVVATLETLEKVNNIKFNVK